MRKLKIIGLDPSLSNWGIAYMSYTPFNMELISTDIIQTKPLKKSNLSKAQQDMTRIDKLYIGVQEALEDADVVVIELPIGSQSARAMASYGACLGLISSINKPRIYVTPNQVKKVVGKNTTSKEEIIEWVNLKHPNILPKTKSKAEHMADAVVAIYAAETQLRKHYENHYHSTRPSNST